MRIGIVGAGVAGLVTAKVLTEVGHDVVVYDRTPDVGGVWSATRRYPGLCTQSPRDTYAFSDFPMPRDLPEWPSGEQVQAYLEAYAAHTGVDRLLRLETEVTSAVPGDTGWVLETSAGTDTVDHLVVANGVFCEPSVPTFPGVEEFTAAGGQVVPATALHNAEQVRDRHVVVLGYGKTACDVAVAVGPTAASTTVVARQLVWKVPRFVGGFLNFKHLLLTRLGESLFRYRYLRGIEKFLHGPANGLRSRILDSLGPVSARQFGLKDLDLVPRGCFEDIVRGAIGLTTDGFYEAVRAGEIAVRRDRTIVRLLEKDGAPHLELDDGTVLRADTLVCATGFRQGVPFLPDDVVARLHDERGNFLLYRQILPTDVADVTFAGYNSSFFSPLNAEMAAAWVAAHLAGRVDLPSPAAMRLAVDEQIAFMDGATDGHHAHGTKIIPFSLHNVDEVLGDLDLDISRGARVKQYLNPVDPSAYAGVAPRLKERLAAPEPAQESLAQA
ncbi:cation diffusion facilitator CzcD-associated flavoprotein CzcO [Actinomycetospora succinea]|uniref:Cation diffusion facilitator CzcD-associated flavoprotein CzcO n=1 Tax=Actinomycetospora succinea TaxID=663603 RepID=A0A4R6VAF1_9PSEU|nr:NAD(P)/FAD-dependent oxidoreductase [Actinomycetospora succinea]TDQ58643.1 cation diffusion facilitator CzcD-associated flavoprotein CzcO [Actinomycetospora succinea]